MPMSNGRLWDDSIFLPPGSKMSPPRFTVSLVAQLGLARATDKEKREGISKWLEDNTPVVSLARSLAKYGYADLLHQHDIQGDTTHGS